jgi:hypothetical protein
MSRWQRIKAVLRGDSGGRLLLALGAAMATPGYWPAKAIFLGAKSYYIATVG